MGDHRVVIDEQWSGELGRELCRVDGVARVMLGGSRARGDHIDSSDYDLGIYYHPPLHTASLAAIARELPGLMQKSPNQVNGDRGSTAGHG